LKRLLMLLVLFPTNLLADDVGRYQIIQGVFTTSYIKNDGEVLELKTESLFRLDTKTGKTWYISSLKEKGKKANTIWVVVDDLGNPND
jgi:hypothetical protein